MIIIPEGRTYKEGEGALSIALKVVELVFATAILVISERNDARLVFDLVVLLALVVAQILLKSFHPLHGQLNFTFKQGLVITPSNSIGKP